MYWYLFSFEGRINRAKFWLSLPILLGLMIGIMLMMLIATEYAVYLAAQTQPHGSAKINVNLSIDELIRMLGLASHLSLSPRDTISLAGNLIGMSILLWIVLAVSVKRLHDRDKSGWWVMLFFVLPCFSDHLPDWLTDSIFMAPLGLASFVLGIWGFIELGFLRGTDRTNLFGPDPLRAKDEDTRLRRSGLGSHAAAWDQRYEIELAPHRASPMSSMHVKRGA
jgi:uncharacterized membrane protein YhaH (DUF805 family)